MSARARTLLIYGLVLLGVLGVAAAYTISLAEQGASSTGRQEALFEGLRPGPIDRSEAPAQQPTRVEVGDRRALTQQARRGDHATWTVRARCCDSRGLPLADVGVCTPNAESSDDWKSGADGRIVIVLPASMGSNHRVVLEFRRGGLASTAREVELSDSTIIDIGDVVMTRGGSVTGYVRAVAGVSSEAIRVRAIEGVAAAADSSETQRRILGRGFRSITAGQWQDIRVDTRGRYLIEGLPLTCVSVVAHAPGCEFAYSLPVQVAVGQDVEVPLIELRALDRWNMIEGRVAEGDGDPVVGATLSLYPQDGSSAADKQQPLVVVRSAAPDGAFACGVPDDSAYVLVCEHPESRMHTRLTEVRAGTKALDVRFAVARWLELEVLSTDGTVIEDPFVVAVDQFRRVIGMRARKVNAAGVLRVLMPESDFWLHAAGAGVTAKVVGPFRAAEMIERLRVTLEPCPKLTGRVLHAGVGVAGAVVHVHALPSDTQFLKYSNGFCSRLVGSEEGFAYFRTDSEGRFAVPLAAPGRLVLHAEAPSLARGESPVIAYGGGGPPEAVTVHLLQGGVVRGVVGRGRRTASATVAATHGDGHIAWAMTDVDGRFELKDLSPGPWQVQVIAPDDQAWLRKGRAYPAPDVASLPSDVVVARGQVAVMNLDHPIDSWIDGILCWNGIQAAGWSITLMRERTRREAMSDWNGGFAMKDLSPGPAEIVFRRIMPGGGELRMHRSIDVREGQNRYELRLESGGVELSGLVGGDAAKTGSASQATFALVWDDQATDHLTKTYRFTASPGQQHAAEWLPVGNVRLVRANGPSYDIQQWERIGAFAIRRGEVTKYGVK